MAYKKRVTEQVNVRLSKDDKQAMIDIAESQGLQLTVWIRRLALKEAKKQAAH